MRTKGMASRELKIRLMLTSGWRIFCLRMLYRRIAVAQLASEEHLGGFVRTILYGYRLFVFNSLRLSG